MTGPGSDDESIEQVVHNEVSGSVIGTVVQAQSVVVGGVHLHLTTPTSIMPQQLPPVPPLFSGRRTELAALSSVLNRAPSQNTPVWISAIGGTRGIGKTWLALHWAHEHVNYFPDGQLFVNLRGFDPAGQPMLPGVAVRGFLDALGVNSEMIPVDISAQAALFRSLVVNKRMLIILDNAYDSAQVEQLVPGGHTCFVIVTSRRRLSALAAGNGALLLDLDVLSVIEARELLLRRLGVLRLESEPDAVSRLLSFCAGLPLALGIVAARISMQPEFPLSILVDELRESCVRLDFLDAGELRSNLRGVLSWSYDALKPEIAVVFSLLGLAFGPDISMAAAASLVAQSAGKARVMLRELENMHLVSQHVPGRYRMHDLVALYAAEQAIHTFTAGDRVAALQRLVDFYLYTADGGDRLFDPNRQLLDIGGPERGCVPQQLIDAQGALDWFDAENLCLLAAVQTAADQGWQRTVWELVGTLYTAHWRRGRVQDQFFCWRAGLIAADELRDPIACAVAHRLLGATYVEVGNYFEALRHLEESLAIAESTGNISGQARANAGLAWISEKQGDYRSALTRGAHVLDLYRILDNPLGKADALHSMGRFHAGLGQFQQANEFCDSAIGLQRLHCHPDGEASTLYTMGNVAYRAGDHAEALDYYRQALAVFRNLGSVYGEANTLDKLGDVYVAVGWDKQARTVWLQAIRLFSAQGRMMDGERVARNVDTLNTM